LDDVIVYEDWHLTTLSGSNGGTIPVLTSSKSFDDNVIPNFAARKARGEVFMNDMKSVTHITEGSVEAYTNIGYRISDGTLVQYQSGTSNHELLLSDGSGLIGFIGTPSINIDSLVDQAVSASYANINQSSFLALASAAEAKETIRTVTNLYRRAFKFLRGGLAVKKKLAQGLMTSAQAANAWLEYRYGIRPIFYEVKNAIEAFSTYGDKPRASYRSFVESEDSTSDTANATNWSTADRTIARSASRHVKVNAGVLVDVLMDSIGVETAFGLNKPFETAWELVPFSFVIDWFFNVGDTLASWTPEAGFRVLGSWVTVDDIVVRANTLASVTPKRSDWSQTINAGPFTRSEYKRTVTRYAHPDRSLVPSLNVRLNASKLVDILALLRQYR
jgi:hypothetical protein